jgi:hypothetical protein
MFKTIVSVASVIATVSVAASAMAGPMSSRTITPVLKLPEGRPPVAVFTCDVDPAIASVTLTKGARPGQVRVSYEVVNTGALAWRSGSGQQVATLNVVNSATGALRAFHRTLPTAAAPGATMAAVTTPTMAAPFDHTEFGGTVEVSIVYDPDIAIDGNICNDDQNLDNNSIRLSAETVLAFLSGPASSQTYRS